MRSDLEMIEEGSGLGETEEEEEKEVVMGLPMARIGAKICRVRSVMGRRIWNRIEQATSGGDSQQFNFSHTPFPPQA